MKSLSVAIVGSLLAVASITADATPISYKFRFEEESGPKGKGDFTYGSCPSGVILNDCPSLSLDIAFDKNDLGLIFDQVLLGGGADAFLGLLIGDSAMAGSFWPAVSLYSLDGLNSLTFVPTGEGVAGGTYCIRAQATATGLCRDDPSVVAIGLYSIKQVPEPGTLGLFGAGLLALAIRRRRRAEP